MDLNLEEQSLLAGFRKLTPTGRRQVAELTAELVKQEFSERQEAKAEVGDRCSVPNRQNRPEAATEPIFTE